MAQRERNKRQRQSKRGGVSSNTQAAIILIVSLLLLGGFLTTYFLAREDASHVGRDFCRKDPIPETIAVIIDHTDKIDTVQKASLERRLQDVAGNLQKNGAIQFFSVEKVGSNVLEPRVSLCSPGSEKEVSALSGNKRLARKHYEERFSLILKDKLKDILTAETAPTSPIMEAVQSAVVTTFIGESNDATTKKMVLVSDLLEHTDSFSLYNGVPNFDDYKKSAHWPQVKSDMSGVDVDIFYLNRPGAGKIQTPQLKLFWQMYFMEQGASSVKFTPIEG